MVTVEEALEAILGRVSVLGAERVDVLGALGRVLAEPVVSRREIPPWPNSSMDGYAVRAEDSGAGARLAVVGRVEAALGSRKLHAAQLGRVDDATLRGCGVSGNKLLALRDLAAHERRGEIPDLRAMARMEDEAIIQALSAVRGIGRWTVQMMLMFRLGRPDQLPVDDLGVRKGAQRIDRREDLPTPRELADFQYRQAVVLMNQGRPDEAESGFREALLLYPENHRARQGLVGLLVQGRKLEEAERVLEEGVKLSPSQIGFNVTLARLLADRGEGARAITTLQSGLEYARGSPEYSAFLAALLQRKGQHEQAIEHFQSALRARPGSGVWWVGLGISLQASNQPAAALDAYRHARASGNLHPDLTALVDQRLRQLQ